MLEQLSFLGEVVDVFNARYGADLSEEDLVRPAQHMVDRVAAEPGWVSRSGATPTRTSAVARTAP